MAEDAITTLLRQSAISFTGTVERLGASSVADLPVDSRTGLVHVDQVLHAPDAFAKLAGSTVTVQFASDAEPPAPDERLALFTNATAFGQNLAVAEVGRLPATAVEQRVALAAGAGQAPLADLQTRIEADQLREHADGAEAVVVGRVLGLAKAGQPTYSEHDPDYWRATMEVQHVERGNVPAGPLNVLYANSQDVRWRHAPKPRAGQDGMWILHATDGALRELAPFQLVHPEDYRPLQHLEALRG
jgi:hypothetical protein